MQYWLAAVIGVIVVVPLTFFLQWWDNMRWNMLNSRKSESIRKR